MIKWFGWLRSSDGAIVRRDAVVLTVTVAALVMTSVVAMRAGTFSAIVDVMSRNDASSGCVQTAASGTTDLSDCQ